LTVADSTKYPLVWLIAGEPSGDILGARLMVALKQITAGNIRIEGIGGEAMAGEGLTSRFPISNIAVMGLVEIIPRLPLIKRRMRQTIDQILTEQPVLVVSIDAPGFCYDIWKGLRGSGIGLVHYVAPTVWAWRPDRAKKFAAVLDHLMTLLPFEPPFFQKEGLAATFVGHPVLEGGAQDGDGAAFRYQHSIAEEATVICVLPGSRGGELKRLGWIFESAARSVIEQYPDAVFVFPTVSYMKQRVEALARSWPGRTVVVGGVMEKFDAMAASNAAMAASGTVSLELALAKVPHVVAYKMNVLTIAIVRMLHGINQKYINLINILLEREVVPEFVQKKCTAANIAAELTALMGDEAQQQKQRDAFSEGIQMLSPAGGLPSKVAAEIVVELLNDPTKIKNDRR
jgi:lipid-A-disaccharide synthase